MKIHGIYIGELVITVNCEYVDGMKAPEKIKNTFIGDELTLAIQQLLQDSLDCVRVEVYKKCADVKFEDENDGKV